MKNTMSVFSLYMEIFEQLTMLKQNNQNIYLVGGAIRDFLIEVEASSGASEMNKESGIAGDMCVDTIDLDFVVTKNVLYIANKFAEKFSSRVIVLDDVNRIYRIVLDRRGESRGILTVDFSLIRGRDIYEDLSRRDFTINAIALPISNCLPTIPNSQLPTPNSHFIDPYNGQLDITRKIIRHISEKNFVDDPLRLLRAYRLKAELKFNVSPKTKKIIKKYSSLISKPAKERIRDELIRIFQSENSYSVLDELDKQRLLERIFPEIKKIKKSAKRHYFHPEGLWQHLKLTLKSVERILSQLTPHQSPTRALVGDQYPGAGSSKERPRLIGRKRGTQPLRVRAGASEERPRQIYQEIAAKALRHISNRIYLLKLLAVFHDISKPQTVKKISGRTRFFGHETSGAKQIVKMLTRLHFSRKDIQVAEKVVKNHMRPGSLAESKILTEKALYRFFRDLGDESVDLLIVSLADRMSYVGISTNQKEIEKHKNFVFKLIEKFLMHKERQSQPKLVDGYVVMNKFGLSPGPIIGRILKLVEESQLLGKISSQEEAFNLIKKHLPKLIKKFSGRS